MIAHHRTRRFATPADERGETLIEIMATVILLGISIVALLTSLLGVITTSIQHRDATRAGNEAITVVETLRGLDYIPCPSSTSYDAALPAPPRGYTYDITAVESLVPSPKSNVDVEWGSNPGCTAATDPGAHRITVRVASTETPTARTLSLVKRRRACPDAAPADPEVC